MSRQILRIGNQLLNIGGKVGEVNPFSPTQISDCYMWYDGNDPSTMTLDGSNFLSRWNDKSGNNYYIEQATALKQPKYVANNGILFSGGQGIGRNNGAIPYTKSLSIFVAYKRTNATNTHIYDDYTNTYQVRLYHQGNTTTYWMRAGSTRQTLYTPILINTPVVSNNISEYATTYMTLTQYENNILRSSAVLSPFATLYTPLVLGCANTYNGTYLIGNIYEYILYTKLLSDSERTEVNNYLQNKWRII